MKKYEECSVVCQDKKKTTISLAREAQVAVNSNDSVIVCVIVGFLMLLWSISYQQWLAAEKMEEHGPTILHRIASGKVPPICTVIKRSKALIDVFRHEWENDCFECNL